MAAVICVFSRFFIFDRTSDIFSSSSSTFLAAFRFVLMGADTTTGFLVSVSETISTCFTAAASNLSRLLLASLLLFSLQDAHDFLLSKAGTLPRAQLLHGRVSWVRVLVFVSRTALLCIVFLRTSRIAVVVEFKLVQVERKSYSRYTVTLA